MNKQLSLFFILFSLLSCSSGKIQHNVPFGDLDHPRTNVSLFDFCSNVRLIQLENCPDAMVSPTHSFSYSIDKNRIYILDRSDNEIKIFDTDGRWIENLGKYGRAGNEYTMAEDLLINHNTETIDILNPVGNIMQYSLSDDGHSFKNKFELPESIPSANKFVIIESGEYIIYSAASGEYFIYDTSNSSVKKLGGIFPDNCEIISSIYGVGDLCLSSSGQFLTYRKMDGTIFSLDSDDSLTPYLEWNIGSHKLLINKVPVYEDIFGYYRFAKRNSFRYASFTGTVYDNGKYTVSAVRYKGVTNIGNLVYDKNKDETFFMRRTIEGCLFFPRSYNELNGIYLLEDNKLLDLFVNDTVLKDERSREVLHSHSDDDNALVVLYTFD